MAKGKKAPMPSAVSPMLCTLTKEPVSDPAYIFEIKWDGYRIISYVKKGSVRMDSRSALDYTKKYPPIVQALKNLKKDVVLDGEVVVFNEEGHPDFDALQLYNGHNSPISYCVFDILWMDGYSLMELPLTERKNILKDLVKGSDVLKFSESFEDGMALYNVVLEKNLEGIVAKKKDSEYLPGSRGYEWLKVPTRKRQEFVIGGWAESENGRAFRSLLFGAYEGKKLKWIGRSGGGYKQKEMPGILKQLKELEISSSPFENKVLDTKGATMHWVKPELVANFEFATWTKSGRIRKPATFLGFRKDKKALQVVREIPKSIPGKKKPVKKKLPSTPGSNWPKVERQPHEDETLVKIDDCSIPIYNVDRNVWRGITKAAVLEYYNNISQYMLPHIIDRPQSLHIKLNGANAPGLYIKDMEGRQPECAAIFSDKRRHKAEGKRDVIDYLVCNNTATLLWMVNIGCIDINPWSSRMTGPETPDYIIIDLDPSEENRTEKWLERLRTAALASQEYCESKKLKTFIKTSGKTGMHFLIPCRGFEFPQARVFAEQICEGIHELVPDVSTTNVSVSQRGGKVFVDPSQNDYADTIAAPYSLRPYIMPTVSTPVDKRELKNIDPHLFTMENIFERIRKKGDLFEEINEKAIIEKNVKSLKNL
jgi:bifunctional non-homologous end joining protein LigD